MQQVKILGFKFGKGSKRSGRAKKNEMRRI